MANLRAGISLAFVTEAITDTMDRVYQLVGKGFVNRLAQAVYVYSKRIALGRIVGPYMVDQFLARNHAVFMSHQVFEDTKSARLEIDLLAGAGDLHGIAIQLEVADANDTGA
jgi:hypothetical protein